VSGRSSQPSGGTISAEAKPAAIFETAQPEADARLLDDANMAVTELEIGDASNIHLEAFDGVLVLSGTVENARDKQEIEAALLRVPAVDSLVQELETEFPSRKESFPAELARAAHDQLLLAPSLVGLGIKVVVENGWLRLEGTVASDAVRNDVLRRVRRLKGSRGVIDRLHIVENGARAGDRELNTQEER
jgi:osmotically-inducible protein OsmY